MSSRIVAQIRQSKGSIAGPVGDPAQQVGVGAGGAGVVFAAGPDGGGPQWPPVRGRDDLDVAAMMGMFPAAE